MSPRCPLFKKFNAANIAIFSKYKNVILNEINYDKKSVSYVSLLAK